MIKSCKIVHILLHIAVCNCFITQPHNNKLCTHNNQLCKHKMNLFNNNITMPPITPIISIISISSITPIISIFPNTLNTSIVSKVLNSKIIKDLPGVIIFYGIYSYILGKFNIFFPSQLIYGLIIYNYIIYLISKINKK